MRKPLLAGNWKMNLLRREAEALVQELASAVRGVTDRDILVCPAFPYLERVVRALDGTGIEVGAQNCAPAPHGAFTGEVSPAMLTDVGCTRVILGHSERRRIHGEDDPAVNAKLRAAVAAGLGPILCVGEALEERQAGRTWTVVEAQLDGALQEVTADACVGLVVAYEPVWAIGTGHTATPDQAQEVHAQIREWVAGRFGAAAAAGLRILYGGSVNGKNVDRLMDRPDVDGALVGGASLQAAEFARLVRFESA